VAARRGKNSESIGLKGGKIQAGGEKIASPVTGGSSEKKEDEDKQPDRERSGKERRKRAPKLKTKT